MNSMEPIKSSLMNIQLGEPTTTLPEQTRAQVPVPIPRPISFLSLIHQWQPMGIRVVVNLPFVGNDMDPLFVVRNGPFIPDPCDSWIDAYTLQDLSVWGFNAMQPVVLTSSTERKPFPDNYGVSVSYYDSPPLLSQISRCFRRWRGDMQYRLRLVAGFVTQGYIIITPVKNTPLAIEQVDEYAYFRYLVDTDSTSFRPKMQNSYIMSDCSMFRHVEVTMPYEYPTPWYDQFQWIDFRTRMFYEKKDDGSIQVTKGLVVQEPFADNWLFVSLRGALEPTRDTSQMSFELEYRAVEGFQFADPSIPPIDIHKPRRFLPRYGDFTKVKRFPNSALTSNGINKITEKPKQSAAQKLLQTLGGVDPKKHLPAGQNVPSYNSHDVSRLHPPQQRSGRVHRDADDDSERASLPSVGPESSTSTTTPEPGTDTVDLRTPSQRRRDAEFSY